LTEEALISIKVTLKFLAANAKPRGIPTCPQPPTIHIFSGGGNNTINKNVSHYKTLIINEAVSKLPLTPGERAGLRKTIVSTDERRQVPGTRIAQ
jgi:hypothetical protein